MVGCVYKVISKVLANRMKRVPLNVIDISQSAFIWGRGILDSILVTNKLVDGYERLKKKIA